MTFSILDPKNWRWIPINFVDIADVRNELSRYKIRIGDNFYIDDIYGVYIEENVTIGKHVKLLDQFKWERPRISIGTSSVIGDECTLYDDVRIGKNVKIGKGVVIKSNSIIEDNVIIDDFSIIEVCCKIKANSQIGRYVNIGNSCVINNSTIAAFCHIDSSVNICNSTIANDVRIGSYTKINKMSKVHSNMIIGSSLNFPEFSDIRSSLCMTCSNGKQLLWNPITGITMFNKTRTLESWVEHLDELITKLDKQVIVEIKGFIAAIKELQAL